jgi:integrase
MHNSKPRMIANTGLRLGEALYLRSEDADLEGKRLHVRNRPDHLTKDREDRIVPINEVALAVLRRRKLAAGGDSGAILFPSRAGTPLDRHNVSHGFKKGRGRLEFRMRTGTRSATPSPRGLPNPFPRWHSPRSWGTVIRRRPVGFTSTATR